MTGTKRSPCPRELHFTPTNGPVDQAIGELIKQVGGVGRAEIVRELILAALKAGQEDNGQADLKMMNTTLKEMRFTAKVFAPYRGVRKVTVFGSARVEPGSPSYVLACQLGQQLKKAGYMVITGGGPGIMQAVNEGAGPDYSFGVNIRLPFEQKPNAVVDGDPKSINYKYFFNRKVAFVKEAHAVALFPGGFGTMDEAMEILTLLQTGKRDPLPLVLVEQPGSRYWSRWLSFLKTELADPGYINQSDFNLVEQAHSAEAAIACIDRFYRRYHSLRYVNGKTVIRMRTPLSQSRIARLIDEFSDILRPAGTIISAGPLPEEADEPAIAHLPRLVMDYSQNHFGRLRALIDRINAAA